MTDPASLDGLVAIIESIRYRSKRKKMEYPTVALLKQSDAARVAAAVRAWMRKTLQPMTVVEARGFGDMEAHRYWKPGAAEAVWKALGLDEKEESK